MGISDYVNRLKDKHRQRQNRLTSSREDKIQVYQAQRKELEKREKTKDTLHREKAAVRDLRTAPIRRGLSNIQRLAKHIKNNKDNAVGGSSSPFASGGFGGGGGGGANPWTGKSSAAAKPKKKKKGITIHIEQ